jgi:hypothetical protein
LPTGADESADGTADGTADGGSSPACLSHPIEGEYRTRFQCAGALHATLTLNVTVAGIAIDQDPVPIDKDFGHAQPGDDYTNPLVMACCVEATDPFCSSSASQSCHVDLIQTSCQSLPERIRQKAEEQGLAGPREALTNLANYMSNNEDACRTSFGLSEVEATAPTCAGAGGSSYGPLLVGRQWVIPATFSGGATEITNVVITVGEVAMTGVHPADLVGAQSCWSLEDNDGTPHFLEIFPSGPLVEAS